MEETEIDIYKLDTNHGKKHHTFRVSILNNRVNLLMTNMNNPSEKHSNLVRLEQFRSACEAFNTTKTIKEALFLLKDTIENSRILISEDEEAGNVDIKFNIRIGDKNYPPFVIGLPLDEPEEEEVEEEKKKLLEIEEVAPKKKNIEVLPTKFDYQGDLEAEAKYGKITKNTTEYSNPIIKSDIKEPQVYLEYIEPVLQVHYPDGTTKSTALPPRLQTADGKEPNINPEQLKFLHEQIAKNFNQSVTEYESQNRSHSVSHKNTNYSRQNINNFENKTRKSNDDNIIEFSKNNIDEVNNIVRSAMSPKSSLITFNNKMSSSIRSTRTSFNPYDNERCTDPTRNDMAPRDNYVKYRSKKKESIFNKKNSYFSTSSVPIKPFLISNFNYGAIPNPSIKNNIYNSTNFNYNDYDQNKIIEEVQNRQSRNINYNLLQRGLNKSSSSPLMITLGNSYQKNENYPQNSFDLNNNQSFFQNKNNNINLRYQNQLNNNLNALQKLNPNKNQQYFHNSNNSFNSNISINLIQNNQNVNQNKINNKILLHKNKLLTRNNSSQGPLISKSFMIQQDIQRLEENQRMQPHQQPLEEKKNLQDNKTVNIIQLDNKNTIKRNEKNRKTQINQQKKNIKNGIPKLPSNSPQNKNRKKRPQLTEKSRNVEKKEIKQKLKPSNSQQIIRQNPSFKNEITQQQIALAQMVSLQNMKNPSNINAITVSLNQKFLDKEGNEETQSQYEREDETREDNGQNDVQQQQQEKETKDKKINEIEFFEQLYCTEEGLIIFRNGLLKGIIHKFAEIIDVVSKIQIKLIAGVKFILLYRASEHGDKAKIFHQKCDNHKMTLVLVETTKGRRFGGFTTQTWDGDCVKKIDNEAFVFNLNNHKIFDVHKNEYAIGGYPKFGPVFFGCQIRIFDEFFKNGGTTCYKSLNYETTKDFELNDGEQTYKVKEIEVYDIQVIKMN